MSAKHHSPCPACNVLLAMICVAVRSWMHLLLNLFVLEPRYQLPLPTTNQL